MGIIRRFFGKGVLDSNAIGIFIRLNYRGEFFFIPRVFFELFSECHIVK
jgi:hypothetical protein